MNGFAILLASAGVLLAGYLVYSRVLALILGVDRRRPTPAHVMRDGVDYVPAHPAILFGHHFATIAGAGPIVGPVLAAQFGWASVLAWVLFGCVFIGAAHDMIALFLSVRHEGRSIGSVIGGILGPSGRRMFLLFSWSALILVTAEFTRQIAATFTANPGIASASLLFIAEAVAFGMCVNRLKLGVLPMSLVFVPLMFASVWIGGMFPIDLAAAMQGYAENPVEAAQTLWTLAILGYCFLASTLPVWMLLQPRDYLNSYLLYAMIAVGLAGVAVAQPEVKMEAFTAFETAGRGGAVHSLFPFLFVTVACGACSGFHALVASGTSSKQISSEGHIRLVGYGAMLLEGLLATLALVGVAGTWDYEGFLAAKGEPVALFARSLAGFCATAFECLGFEDAAASGGAAAEGFILLAVSAFLMTSVDSSTRLARFTWQEFFPLPDPVLVDRGALPPPRLGERIKNSMYTGTGAVVLVTGVLLLGDPAAAKSLWTTFASANQMLAALTLLAATLWFVKHRKPAVVTMVPMLFMMAVSVTALVVLFTDAWSAADVVKIAATGLLLFLAGNLVVFGTMRLLSSKKSGGGYGGRDGRHHHHHHHHHGGER